MKENCQKFAQISRYGWGTHTQLANRLCEFGRRRPNSQGQIPNSQSPRAFCRVEASGFAPAKLNRTFAVPISQWAQICSPRSVVSGLASRRAGARSKTRNPGPESQEAPSKKARKPESPKPETRKLQERTLTTVKFCRQKCGSHARLC